MLGLWHEPSERRNSGPWLLAVDLYLYLFFGSNRVLSLPPTVALVRMPVASTYSNYTLSILLWFDQQHNIPVKHSLVFLLLCIE